MPNNPNTTAEPVVVIDWIGGHCPVQAEGTIAGKAFYFRARGAHWSLGIGGADPCGEAEWEHVEWFGNWPDAGWMTVDEAEAFLRAAAARYANGLPAGRLEDDEEKMQAARAVHRVMFGGAEMPTPETTKPNIPTEALIIGLRASAASRWPDDIKRQNEWMDQQLKIALGEAANAR